MIANSRGGRKPVMLNVVHDDLPIRVENRLKFGIYEIGFNGVLARRVELPAWATAAFKSGAPLRPPAEEIGESRGHVFMKPPRALFDGPAVGIDIEVWNWIHHQPDGTVRLLAFFVYGTDHELLDVWEIAAKRFIDSAKFVQTKPSFMPQMMVAISSLQQRSHA